MNRASGKSKDDLLLIIDVGNELVAVEQQNISIAAWPMRLLPSTNA
jgi:hypothetical protein